MKEIDIYFKGTSAPIIERARDIIILLNKTIIADNILLSKKYPVDILERNSVLICKLAFYIRRIG